jgi:hypothetical protein
MQLSSSQDAGSLPRLEMVAEGLIFDARHAEVEEATNYNGSLLPLASGVLLAGWQCGREKHTPTNTLRIAQSVDHGQSWQVLAWRFDPHWQGVKGSFLAAAAFRPRDGRSAAHADLVRRVARRGPQLERMEGSFHTGTDGVRRHRAGIAVGGWDARLRL